MKVLIVEDEADLREEIVNSLKWTNYKLHTADNGRQAFDMIQADPAEWDAVITDIKMPVMDGLTLLKTLRKKDYQIPVIIMTGHGDFEISLQALRLGAFDFILKPFDPDILEELLHKLETFQESHEVSSLMLSYVRQVELDIPSDTSLILNVVNYLQSHFRYHCKQYQINLTRIHLCLYEALTNAVVHGNLEVDSSLKEESWDTFFEVLSQREGLEKFRNRQVHLVYRAMEDRLEFEFTDQGKGFNAQKRLDVHELDDVVSSGRGLLLIKTYMDEVEWNETGNRIRMVKYLKNSG
ncbi:MAG: response regulator [SAR324 cluster bacterium]|nr:response regulator [SAR324 cluster bacterium]